MLRPFRFRGCLLAKAERRNAHTASVMAPSVDDIALIDFFNHAHRPSRGATTGILRNRQIASPEAFIPVATATMARADYIVRRIMTARVESEKRKIVKNIDRLSDLLCGIIDMTELIRHTHPEKAWVDAANNAYDILCEYMNGLNTHSELAEVSTSDCYIVIITKEQLDPRQVHSQP